VIRLNVEKNSTQKKKIIINYNVIKVKFDELFEFEVNFNEFSIENSKV